MAVGVIAFLRSSVGRDSDWSAGTPVGGFDVARTGPGISIVREFTGDDRWIWPAGG